MSGPTQGISIQEAARRAVREFVARGAHRQRVSSAAERVIAAHRDALDRLGGERPGRVSRPGRCPRPRSTAPRNSCADPRRRAARLAVARPQTTVGGEDAYPDLWSKAAALLPSIVGTHSLVDGNKRLGWLSTAVFLELNGEPVTATSNGDVYEFVMAVAMTTVPMDQMVKGLRALVRP